MVQYIKGTQIIISKLVMPTRIDFVWTISENLDEINHVLGHVVCLQCLPKYLFTAMVNSI